MAPPTDKTPLASQRTLCDELLNQLDTFEQVGNDFFQHLQQALTLPYPVDQAQQDLRQLLTALDKFQDQARASGHLGITANPPAFRIKSDAIKWNDERNKRNEALLQQKDQLVGNIGAALSVNTTSQAPPPV
ncbi:hypothetical protein H4R34_001015 [Dimargaris verticillata]|uniref:Uncharacterized protein n=1 Tax=Dimargaris verticillata TaxID=2761393 RepID=A0A9W8BC87_9FUNG|nr:hypothetical protein H4R34_001015 [Dimargaris verticillata]